MLVSSRCRERECIERAGGCAEVLLGQVQIDCRLLKVAMTEQHLDGAQVSAGFQKMGRKTMSQSMRMNVPVSSPARRAAALHTFQIVLSEIGCSTPRWPQLLGNRYTCGRLERQYSRKASSSLGLSMTSRSLRPFPPWIWTTMRRLSMSLSLSVAASARRAPVA